MKNQVIALAWLVSQDLSRAAVWVLPVSFDDLNLFISPRRDFPAKTFADMRISRLKCRLYSIFRK